MYQSELLTAYAEQVIHGFTGKPITLGGPSHPADVIHENRLALCRHAGLNEVRLTLPRQTHTNCYRINDLPFENDADAVILTEPGIPAMVQVADCVPVILYDPEQHVGAVVHAGWRGTAQTITQTVAQRLINEYNATPEHLIAVIGPSIGGCCYEVSDEVASSVAATIPNTPPKQWQTMSTTSGKPYIDLKQVNRLQLQELGVQRIELIGACTRCEEETLWSYRRGENGRQVAFLQLL